MSLHLGLFEFVEPPTKEELKVLVAEENSLAETFHKQCQDDDECYESQSHHLLEAYLNSNDRESVDLALVSLCGWSMHNLINQTLHGNAWGKEEETANEESK